MVERDSWWWWWWWHKRIEYGATNLVNGAISGTCEGITFSSLAFDLHSRPDSVISMQYHARWRKMMRMTTAMVLVSSRSLAWLEACLLRKNHDQSHPPFFFETCYVPITVFTVVGIEDNADDEKAAEGDDAPSSSFMTMTLRFSYVAQICWRSSVFSDCAMSWIMYGWWRPSWSLVSLCCWFMSLLVLLLLMSRDTVDGGGGYRTNATRRRNSKKSVNTKIFFSDVAFISSTINIFDAKKGSRTSRTLNVSLKTLHSVLDMRNTWEYRKNIRENTNIRIIIMFMFLRIYKERSRVEKQERQRFILIR